MKRIFIILIVFGCTGRVLLAEEYIQLQLLEGDWKFSIGDNSEWAKPDYDDHQWDNIKVPSAWEEQGYYGYDGFAWYRKTVFIPKEYRSYNLFVELGYIDDVDEVFVNGEKIGQTGEFPPKNQTAYNARRFYQIPAHLSGDEGKMVIAVRTYDWYREGGIVSGHIALYRERTPLIPDIDLQGLWYFRTGDNLQWASQPDFRNGWQKIIVPGKWENQGFKDYNGIAWYAREIKISTKLANQKLVLVLGKIDDIDQVYINGQLVALTGDWISSPADVNVTYEYQAFRGYYLPAEIFMPGEVNTIMVRVFDKLVDGGIYEGPVGIITQEKYIRYWRQRKVDATQ